MSNRPERAGAVICGAYGMENAGDDAVLAAIVAALRRIDESMPITVLARKPRSTAGRFGVSAIHPFRFVRWIFAMRRAKLFISGGGTLLQDITSVRSLWYYLATIYLAKRLGCAVQLYGCGAGPLRLSSSREKTAQVLNGCADAITVRDEDSLSLLKKIGVIKPRILLSAEPALSLGAPRGERERRFGVILRPWAGGKRRAPALAEAVRYAWEKYRLAPVFLCLGPGDRAEAEAVCALCGDIPYSVSIDSRRVGRMSLVLSMRLHGLVFALRGGAPAAGVSYDPKVASFCREAHLPYLQLEELDADGLRRVIDEAAHLDAERLSAAAAALIARERVNAVVAAELLSGVCGEATE